MKKQFQHIRGAAGLTCVLLAALVGALAAHADPTQFSDWSAPVNLGAVVNSTADDVFAFISRDERSLYFSSNRPGGFGGFDIWVSQRGSRQDPWGPPQNVGPNINSSSNELTPSLSRDGRRLYFGSNRPGGFGGEDLYVARRRNRRNDFGWFPSENLGSGVNSPANEGGPFRFDDDDDDDECGTTTLLFNSDRTGGLGSFDIYASTLNEDADDEIFDPALLVSELSTSLIDRRPVIRRDGLELLLESNRTGAIGGSIDLWVSTRTRTSDPWSTPSNLGPVVNSAAVDGRPALTSKGTGLYFNSNRAGSVGGQDLYVSTRTRLRDADDEKGGDDDDRRRGEGRMD
jgi:WD40 repeat protein